MSNPDFSELEADFGDVMDILRQGRLEPPTERPDPAIWEAIADGLSDAGVAGGQRPVDEFPADTDAIAVAGVEPIDAAVPTDVAVPDRDGLAAPVVSLDSRRLGARRVVLLTALAAAFLLVAVPLGLALRSEPVGQRAELAALGGFEGAGTAELDGRTLKVNLDGLRPLENATYDLWLLDLDEDDPQDPLWIGIAAPEGTFTVPEDVDLNRFNVVDVSREPDDGNPAHSGDSVLRGGLEQA